MSWKTCGPRPLQLVFRRYRYFRRTKGLHWPSVYALCPFPALRYSQFSPLPLLLPSSSQFHHTTQLQLSHPVPLTPARKKTVIVRRVIEARRLHASPPSNQQSLSPLPSGSAALPPRAAKATASSALADGTNGVMGDSFSRTRPLEPVWGNGKGGKERKRKKGEKEDGGVGNADGNGDGSEKGRGKGWMRLRCW